ncbi:hypothetical protein BESB_049400 [Besnoitia besnoiti]|uniref:Uncharacterized protein n=1 Tax=Besnoitia besnoiti TaxID=94643 RepID=A0A2A9ME08_BESBE|nr:hypothetical protein BESB_049400 [Besnoitia besnoiti]PFH36748.1 hypothetical protein BESB_049400 [Besnoitia besnoiti]
MSSSAAFAPSSFAQPARSAQGLVGEKENAFEGWCSLDDLIADTLADFDQAFSFSSVVSASLRRPPATSDPGSLDSKPEPPQRAPPPPPVPPSTRTRQTPSAAQDSEERHAPRAGALSFSAVSAASSTAKVSQVLRDREETNARLRRDTGVAPAADAVEGGRGAEGRGNGAAALAEASSRAAKHPCDFEDANTPATPSFLPLSSALAASIEALVAEAGFFEDSQSSAFSGPSRSTASAASPSTILASSSLSAASAAVLLPAARVSPPFSSASVSSALSGSTPETDARSCQSSSCAERPSLERLRGPAWASLLSADAHQGEDENASEGAEKVAFPEAGCYPTTPPNSPCSPLGSAPPPLPLPPLSSSALSSALASALSSSSSSPAVFSSCTDASSLPAPHGCPLTSSASACTSPAAAAAAKSALRALGSSEASVDSLLSCLAGLAAHAASLSLPASAPEGAKTPRLPASQRGARGGGTGGGRGEEPCAAPQTRSAAARTASSERPPDGKDEFAEMSALLEAALRLLEGKQKGEGDAHAKDVREEEPGRGGAEGTDAKNTGWRKFLFPWEQKPERPAGERRREDSAAHAAGKDAEKGDQTEPGEDDWLAGLLGGRGEEGGSADLLFLAIGEPFWLLLQVFEPWLEREGSRLEEEDRMRYVRQIQVYRQLVALCAPQESREKDSRQLGAEPKEERASQGREAEDSGEAGSHVPDGEAKEANGAGCHRPPHASTGQGMLPFPAASSSSVVPVAAASSSPVPSASRDTPSASAFSLASVAQSLPLLGKLGHVQVLLSELDAYGEPPEEVMARLSLGPEPEPKSEASAKAAPEEPPANGPRGAAKLGRADGEAPLDAASLKRETPRNTQKDSFRKPSEEREKLATNGQGSASDVEGAPRELVSQSRCRDEGEAVKDEKNARKETEPERRERTEQKLAHEAESKQGNPPSDSSASSAASASSASSSCRASSSSSSSSLASACAPPSASASGAGVFSFPPQARERLSCGEASRAAAEADGTSPEGEVRRGARGEGTEGQRRREDDVDRKAKNGDKGVDAAAGGEGEEDSKMMEEFLAFVEALDTRAGGDEGGGDLKQLLEQPLTKLLAGALNTQELLAFLESVEGEAADSAAAAAAAAAAPQKRETQRADTRTQRSPVASDSKELEEGCRQQ